MFDVFAHVGFVAVELGEFGAYEKGGLDSRVRYISCVAREAEKRGWMTAVPPTNIEARTE